LSLNLMTRGDRLEESRAKIAAPFVLDDTMRFYSPQENVEALSHPRVKAFTQFVSEDYEPELPPGTAVALLLPCTKHKPYPLSLEHRRINAALLRAGFRPADDDASAKPFVGLLGANEDPAVLSAGPLVRDDRVVHRFVLSEPMAVVPYEFVYRWEGGQSPAASYDDPGLFEHRGTSVSPWRRDSTAKPKGNGRWTWGDNERAAYVEVHNRLSAIMAGILYRLRGRYARIVSWVAPGLTHRSFLLAAGQRPIEGIAGSRVVRGRREGLVGVNDRVPGLVDVHPTRAESTAALERLTERIRREDPRASGAAVRAVYARGGGGATPLALPELLDVLLARISEA
jgi:hypothetical protein